MFGLWISAMEIEWGDSEHNVYNIDIVRGLE